MPRLAPLAFALALPLLTACRLPMETSAAPALAEGERPTLPAGPAATAALGEGAAPGDARGPGGFVPRGDARCFYAGAGGRLWYYLNHYYWVRPDLVDDDLWIKAEVVECFEALRRWPDGRSAPSPAPRTTTEYWRVGATGRSVRLDNHKDYCLLAHGYTAGAIAVEVTLTVGRLAIREGRGTWRRPEDAYVLEARNYSGGGGIGAGVVRFTPLPAEAVTLWRYRVPFSSHPERMTRSRWARLAVPTWEAVERRAPLPDADEGPTPQPSADGEDGGAGTDVAVDVARLHDDVVRPRGG